jgi:hypothetical protein
MALANKATVGHESDRHPLAGGMPENLGEFLIANVHRAYVARSQLPSKRSEDLLRSNLALPIFTMSFCWKPNPVREEVLRSG